MKPKRHNGKANGHPPANGHAAAPASNRGDGRDHRGWFTEGAPPGPGRPKKTISEFLLDAARELATPMEAARSAVEIARELSPAMMLRAFEVAHDPAAEHKDVLEAVRLVVERAYGLPSQAVMNLNADVMLTPEAREQVQARAAEALERLRARYAAPQVTDAEPSSGRTGLNAEST